MATAAATTRRSPAPAPGSGPKARSGGTSGPDRLTVTLLALAGFMVVLALLAWQLRPASARPVRRPVVVLRKIYRTTIVETIAGGNGASATSVSQSVSASGSSYAPSAAPTTRSSGR
jgi:hypothetical protein